MKTLFISFLILFTTKAFSAENLELFSTVGITPSGSECTYVVMQMNSWEGQIVIFMSGPNGNFRVELDTEAYEAGKYESPYSDVEMSYVNQELHTVVPKAESDDTDKIVNIVFNSEGLFEPVLVEAIHSPRELTCQFTIK